MRQRSVFLFLFVVTLIAGCGSGASARPATIAKPDLAAVLTHEIFFGSGSSAPATIEIRLHNRATQPITIRRVELSSPGMLQFAILPITREFRQAIGPGETKAVTVFATAVTNTSRPTEPLTIRAIVYLESGEARWREIIMGNIMM